MGSFFISSWSFLTDFLYNISYLRNFVRTRQWSPELDRNKKWQLNLSLRLWSLSGGHAGECGSRPDVPIVRRPPIVTGKPRADDDVPAGVELSPSSGHSGKPESTNSDRQFYQEFFTVRFLRNSKHRFCCYEISVRFTRSIVFKIQPCNRFLQVAFNENLSRRFKLKTYRYLNRQILSLHECNMFLNNVE